MIEDDLSFVRPLYNGNTALILLDDMRVLLHQKPVLVLLKERLKVIKRLHGSSSNDGEPTPIDNFGELCTLKAKDLNSNFLRVLPLQQQNLLIQIKPSKLHKKL